MVFLKCKQCAEEFEWTLYTKYFRHICKKCGQASEYNLDSSAELILESSSNEEQTSEEQTSEEQTLIQRFEELDQGKSFQKHYDEIIKYAPTKYVDIKDLQLDDKLQKVIEGQTTGAGAYKGIYEYQKEAYDKIIRGKDVAITAPTGSGKTLSFLMPIIQRIINNGAYGKLDTIVVSPIKALTNDQYLQIKRFVEPCGITVGIHTGDVKPHEKQKNLKNSPEILCTNFDSIYVNLYKKTGYAPLFYNFNTIVVDELHYYSGVHGSNIHHILAALKKNNPKLQMVGASATIDNLDKFAKKIFNNNNVEIIKTDQKNGKTNFVIIAPKGITFTTLLMKFCNQLKKWDKSFLIFWDSKTGIEKFATRAWEKEGLKIEPHRAGLKPHERKEIEDGLKSKKLDGLVCTPTLELGIDIGSIEVVFSILVPWGQFKQRMGRAGRRGQLGTGILVLGDDPVSSWFKKHPKDYQTPHIVHINPENRRVTKFMFPFRVQETNEPMNNFFTTDEKYYKRNEKFFLEKKLFSIENNLIKPNERGQIRALLDNYNIRAMGPPVKIYEKPFAGFTGKYTNNHEIGFEATPLAYQRFHIGYIYMHKRKAYEIIETHMNPQDDSSKAEHYVIVQEKKYVSSNPKIKPVPYYTRTQYLKDPTILDIPEPKKDFVGGMHVLHAELDIDKTVFSYGKFNLYNDDPIDQNIPIDGETFKFQTKGVVAQIPIIKENCHLTEIKAGDESKMGPMIKDDVIEGLHTIEHLLQSAGVTIVGMSLQDLDGIYEDEKLIKCPVCKKGDIYTILICPHCKSEKMVEKEVELEHEIYDDSDIGQHKHRTIEGVKCLDCKKDFKIGSIPDDSYKCNSCQELFSSFKEMKINRKIYIYDDSGDGESGVTEAIYYNIEETLRRAFEIVSTEHFTKDGAMCVETNGCNNCTFLMLKCQEFNENLNKPEAIKTLEMIVYTIFKQKLEKIKYEKLPNEIRKMKIQELRDKYEKLLNVKKEIDDLENEINDEY